MTNLGTGCSSSSPGCCALSSSEAALWPLASVLLGPQASRGSSCFVRSSSATSPAATACMKQSNVHLHARMLPTLQQGAREEPYWRWAVHAMQQRHGCTAVPGHCLGSTLAQCSTHLCAHRPGST